MFGLIKKGNSYQVQYRVPADVREHFDGLKKKSKTIDADNDRDAERLAAEEQRLFKRRVLDLRQAKLSGDAEVNPERLNQAIGCLFALTYPMVNERTDFESLILGTLGENDNEDRYPLLTVLPRSGALFDDIVAKIEELSNWTDSSAGTNGRRKQQERPEATLVGAHAVYARRTKHIQKTQDQYLKDVTDFTKWFEINRRGTCYGVRIKKGDVNDYVEYMMDQDRALATTKRALSACAHVYKIGRFGDDNPFARVTDRMVVTGSQMKVRPFTDREVIGLLKLKTDPNVHMSLLIAVYSGMRLSEIADLKIDHIEKVGSSRVFNLFNAGRRKTKASYRKVPVHPMVWKELGPFIKGRDADEYVLAGEVPNKYGNRSANLSKRLATAIDTITTDETAREHSARHTFITKLADAGVQREWRKAIVGHAGEDAHDDYTHADFITELLKHVQKVAYA